MHGCYSHNKSWQEGDQGVVCEIRYGRLYAYAKIESVGRVSFVWSIDLASTTTWRMFFVKMCWVLSPNTMAFGAKGGEVKKVDAGGASLHTLVSYPLVCLHAQHMCVVCPHAGVACLHICCHKGAESIIHLVCPHL